jgi:transcriptional regulator
VLFQGSNSYISPNWYPSKKTDSKVVPTWNYTAVHATGEIEFINDPDWLMALLNDLTNKNEITQNQPWAVSDAPSKFIDKQLPAIVGIEIMVDELKGKFKLSQNQTPENRQGVQSGLSGLGHEMTDLIDV